MDFKAATDRLMELGVTASDIAEVLELQPNTVRAMRLAPSASGYRTPPDDWTAPVAKLARERGGELVELAEELEG